MRLGHYYFNLSLKTKFIIIILSVASIVSIALGYYSFKTSKSQIVKEVSNSNLAVTEVIDSNLTSMQQSISDWVTVFALSSIVQNKLQEKSPERDDFESALYRGPEASIMNQMLVMGDFDYLSLYGNMNEPLFQLATDDSSGPGTLGDIRKSDLYQKASELNGASLWFPLTEQNNVFIENNRKEKLGMTRIIRSSFTGKKLGFIFVGINYETIRNQYLRNLYDKDHGIVILDPSGSPLLSAGKEFYQQNLLSSVTGASDSRQTDSVISKTNGEELLLTYNKMNNGWIIVYSVPLASLTKELDSIKLFVVIVILICLLLCVPMSMILSTILIAPIKQLLVSMRRFQNGHFDERVEVKYQDEIGILSQGYNKMVSNIKSLVDESYVLRLKEQEAELKSLQSQINPHFLYNMLDMIFWEAERSGQDRISEMVIALSRMFRLSLNRGKSFTSLGKEKDFINQYLTLQQMRFKEKLTYSIDIPDELDQYVVLKLCLQPFIENALIHGIERKREGGFVHVSCTLENDYLLFVVVDNGNGMSADTLKSITEIRNESEIYTAPETGGYAIQNVIQRLHHFYKDNYELKYFSQPGQGTKVELMIPAIKETQEEKHDSSNGC